MHDVEHVWSNVYYSQDAHVTLCTSTVELSSTVIPTRYVITPAALSRKLHYSATVDSPSNYPPPATKETTHYRIPRLDNDTLELAQAVAATMSGPQYTPSKGPTAGQHSAGPQNYYGSADDHTTMYTREPPRYADDETLLPGGAPRSSEDNVG